MVKLMISKYGKFVVLLLVFECAGIFDTHRKNLESDSSHSITRPGLSYLSSSAQRAAKMMRAEGVSLFHYLFWQHRRRHLRDLL